MSERVLLRGGRVVDPSQGLDRPLDVLLTEGRVARVGEGLTAPEGALVVDCAGRVVAPGLIDVHVHLREPGEEHKETIRTGARAGADGLLVLLPGLAKVHVHVDESRSHHAPGAVHHQGAFRRGQPLPHTGDAALGEEHVQGAVQPLGGVHHPATPQQHPLAHASTPSFAASARSGCPPASR